MTCRRSRLGAIYRDSQHRRKLSPLAPHHQHARSRPPPSCLVDPRRTPVFRLFRSTRSLLVTHSLSLSRTASYRVLALSLSRSRLAFLFYDETKSNRLSLLLLSHIPLAHQHISLFLSRAYTFLFPARGILFVPSTPLLFSFSFPRVHARDMRFYRTSKRATTSFSLSLLQSLLLHFTAPRSALSSLHRRFRPTYPNYNERP